MIALSDPGRAYRRVQRDAAIMGSDGRALTLLCYDEFLDAISAALHADTNHSADGFRRALGRANQALAAIHAGTDPAHPLAPVLGGFLDAAGRALRAAMVQSTPHSLETIRDDFREIRAALAEAA